MPQEKGLPTLTELEPGDHEGGFLPRPSPPRLLASAHLQGGPMVVAVGPRATTSVGELTDLGHPSQQDGRDYDETLPICLCRR